MVFTKLTEAATPGLVKFDSFQGLLPSFGAYLALKIKSSKIRKPAAFAPHLSAQNTSWLWGGRGLRCNFAAVQEAGLLPWAHCPNPLL